MLILFSQNDQKMENSRGEEWKFIFIYFLNINKFHYLTTTNFCWYFIKVYFLKLRNKLPEHYLRRRAAIYYFFLVLYDSYVLWISVNSVINLLQLFPFSGETAHNKENVIQGKIYPFKIQINRMCIIIFCYVILF